MSTYQIEKEYKMMLEKNDFYRIITLLKFDKIIKQNNHYYSSPLSNVGMRIREIDNHFSFTLKQSINNEVREYEWNINNHNINDQTIIDLLKDLNINDQPLFLGSLYTIRYFKEYEKGFLCLDENHYFNKVDYELEYELKDHLIDDFTTLDGLLKDFDLKFKLNKNSKYKRFLNKRSENMKKVAVFCANGLEECEALVTIDLLKRANIETHTIAIDDKLDVISSHKLNFKADLLMKDININDYDAIILPGGIPGTDYLMAKEELITYLKDFKNQGKLIAAICAAPSILIKNDLVNNGKFSVYPGFECGYQTSNKKVTVDNNIITAQGLGVVFEFAYEIIKYLKDETCAKAIFHQIQH